MARRQYQYAHQATRRTVAYLVDAGAGYCTEIICLMADRWIEPGTPWDLAHHRATGAYLGPAHRRCNRSEGARHKQGRHDRWDL